MAITPRSSQARPRLSLPRSGLEITVEAAAAGGLFFLLLLVAGSWSSLPEEIPRHFGASGRPDATGPRWTILILPSVGVVLYVALTFLARFPHRANYLWPITAENAPRQYRLARTALTVIKGEIVWFFGYLVWRTVQVANGAEEGLGVTFLPIFLVVTFGTLGGYLMLSYRAR